MADEIERLRELRDAGALTEDQYARAVDRVVGGDSKRRLARGSRTLSAGDRTAKVTRLPLPSS